MGGLQGIVLELDISPPLSLSDPHTVGRGRSTTTGASTLRHLTCVASLHRRDGGGPTVRVIRGTGALRSRGLSRGRWNQAPPPTAGTKAVSLSACGGASWHFGNPRHCIAVRRTAILRRPLPSSGASPVLHQSRGRTSGAKRTSRAPAALRASSGEIPSKEPSPKCLGVVGPSHTRPVRRGEKDWGTRELDGGGGSVMQGSVRSGCRRWGREGRIAFHSGSWIVAACPDATETGLKTLRFTHDDERRCGGFPKGLAAQSKLPLRQTCSVSE